MKKMLKAGTALATLLAPLAASVSVAAQDDDSDVLEEITVTGSYIKRKNAADSSSPIQVLGQTDLGRLGGNTIADITRTLTANAGAENNPDSFTQNTTAGTENINLRGLGVASTLVLLNGKRTVASAAHTDSGVAFVDTASLMPGIVIDQLEVLKNGGAALYGSDAVGGVANFKTRLGFEGVEMRVDYQSAGGGDQDDLTAQMLYGYNGDRFQFIIAGSSITRSNLSTRERDLRPASAEATGLTVSGTTSLPGNWLINLSPTAAGIAPVDDITGDGIPDYNFYWGSQPDAFCADAIGVIPEIQMGTTELAGFEQPSCAYDYQNVFDLIPEHDRTQGYFEFNADLSDDHSFYGNLSYSDNKTRRQDSNFPIPFPILIPNAPALLGDPSLAAYPFLYPFYYPGLTPTQSPNSLWLGRSPGLGQIDDYSTLEPNVSTTNSKTLRYMAGFKGTVGSWSYDLSFTHGENDYDFTSRDGVTSRLTAAIFGFGGPDCGGPTDPTAIPGVGGCMFYNVRGDGMLADPSATVDLIAIARDGSGNPIFLPDGSLATGPSGITVPVRNSPEMLNWITQPLQVVGKSTTDVFDAVFAGDLMEISSGTIQMAVGYQYRAESEMYDYDDIMNAFDFAFASGANDFDENRNVHAFFVETGIPLTEKLDLQAALRYESFSDGIGDTLDPQIALLYRPNSTLSMRASFATSFRAPSVFQLAGSQTNVQNVVIAGFVPVEVSGNPDLSPEQSTNINFGATWEPNDNWTINMDIWNIKFTDVIVKEAPDNLVVPVLLGFQGLPGGDLSRAQFSTGPVNPNAQVFVDNSIPGLERVTRVVSNYFNSEFIETNGIDLQISYRWDTEDMGSFNIGVDAVYVNKYDVSTDRGVEDGAGSRNRTNFASPVPSTRANLFATWTKGNSSLSAFVRHTGAFDDDENCVNPGGLTFEIRAAGGTCSEFAQVDSMTTVDLQYDLNISEMLGTANSSISLGAINVFDQAPPFVYTDGAYETRTHDPRGRMIYARLKFGF